MSRAVWWATVARPERMLVPKGVHGSKAPHGTRARYDAHGCRCQKCRDASSAYMRERRGQRPRAEYLADVTKEHGAAAYRSGRCRCNVCRAISAGVKRRYRQAHPDYAARENAARVERRRAGRG